MGLSASLQVGKSGLLAHQTGIQVTGNNLANLATPGYKRRTVEMSPIRDQSIGRGLYVGRGVQIGEITREVNEALETRLRNAITDENASAATQDLLGRLEAIQNELSNTDLTTRLNTYFNAWSQLATNPQDISLRTVVVQEAGNLTSFIKDLRTGYGQLEKQIDDELGVSVRQADDILQRIEQLNRQITVAEGGQGESGGLRDQRDALLGELSKSLAISTVEHPNGQIDVFVGSLPIMLDGKSRGLSLRDRVLSDPTTPTGQRIIKEVIIDADGSVISIDKGDLGAKSAFRNGSLQDAIDAIDDLAGQLIFETNKLHSTGQGLDLRNSYSSTNRVTDTTVAITDDNAELEFKPGHGSFQIHTTSKATGIRTTSTINVDLDGINPAADTTLNSLVASIDAVNGLSATINSDGTILIAGDTSDTLVSFTDDTSGVLASLGIGGFFRGEDAFDIQVDADVKADPRLLAVGQDHLPGDNRNALALAGLRDTPNATLDGLSIGQHWTRHVEGLAVRLAQARDQFEADGVVRENLQTQQAAVSGVNADEETINLLQFQRAYQASARFIGVVDELMQTLVNLV
jgi:flagellar hook-associated protein 1 FlgK